MGKDSREVKWKRDGILIESICYALIRCLTQDMGYRPEAQPVVWGDAVGKKGFSVGCCAVAGVPFPSIFWVALAKLYHQLIPHHLRNDGGRRDGKADPVTSYNGADRADKLGCLIAVDER